MKNFDVNRYLNQAEESFSGFDGYGDDLEFGNDNWSMASGVSEGASMLQSPSPYQVTVTNTTAGTLNLVLFGNNQYLLSPNFGSSVGLTVIPSQTNVTYLELLQQSASSPFETSLIRIQSDNDVQVTQNLTITVKDANGQLASLPLIINSYFSSYQQQAGIVDVPYTLKVDGNTSIQSLILPTTTVVYTFFPSEKVNISSGLAGNSAVKTYGNPQVNLGGMTFPKRPTVGTQTRRRIG